MRAARYPTNQLKTNQERENPKLVRCLYEKMGKGRVEEGELNLPISSQH